MILTRKNLVNDLILVIKKAAHMRAERSICLDKLYNNSPVTVKPQNNSLIFNKLGWGKAYETGYIDADIYDWSILPLDLAFSLIDSYKSRALRYQSEYFAGLAQGAEDLVKKRKVAV